MKLLLIIGDALVVIFLCLALLFAIVLLLGAIVGIGQAIYDGWTGRKDGADNEN